MTANIFKNKQQNSEPEKKMFICHLCGNTFRQQLGLSRHIKKHLGDLPYKCPECGKRFVQSDKLKRHMVVHSGEKPFTCPICHKNYTQKAHLNVHIKAHVSFRFKILFQLESNISVFLYCHF